MNIVIRLFSFILNIKIFKAHRRGKYTPKGGENTEVTWARETLLTETVKGYIVGDLKRLLNIKVINSYDGNVNFPIVLYTFSCMDFLGYLIAAQNYKIKGDTEKKIKDYIDSTFTNEDKEKLEPYMDYFVNIFRHGLTHTFFPKKAGVSRTNPEIFTYQPDGDYIVLDADQLAKMFIRSIENLEAILEKEDVCDRVYGRYQKILDDHKSTTTGTSTNSSTIPYGTARGTATVQPPQDLYPSSGDTGCADI